jgi:hypothetical protein
LEGWEGEIKRAEEEKSLEGMQVGGMMGVDE